MKLKSIWLRRIHKWVGLIIGLQFLLWAISGTAMALLDMEEVEGGAVAENPAPRPVPNSTAWPRVQEALDGQPITGLRLRSFPQGLAYQVTTGRGVHLFSAADGRPVEITSATAGTIARSAHPEGRAVRSVEALKELSFAVRDHELPIWQVNFGDAANSNYYVSGTTGEILARRNDTWRWWDFFWMLHIMDYSERSSFNHPLIITVGFAMVWLAITGFWLLFRTMWRHDLATLKRGLNRPPRRSFAQGTGRTD